MALWEYKVISSGKGGFATPALLESFLNQLGTEDWEIIEFRTQPDNPLAFSGLARRPTQRDWTLEAAAAAAAKVEADKLRAEFAAKFQAASKPASADESAADASGDGVVRDDSFRSPRDTDYDQDPDALDDSTQEEEEEWPEEDHLPSFFEAIRPHMRRNQKGPGYSVGVDYLVKKFSLIEEDLMTALQECGFAIPEDEDDKPVYIEYDGDLYWLNTNRRGELWINTREKPRPVFRVVKGTPLSPEQAEETVSQQADQQQQQQQQRQGRNKGDRRREGGRAQAPSAPVSDKDAAAEKSAPPEATEASSANSAAAQPQAAEQVAGSTDPLPTGEALMKLLKPQMRRSRGGLSGTISFLTRALKVSEETLLSALASTGLHPASKAGEKAPVVELGDLAYWLNRDSRGGIWINARDARRLHKEQGEQGEQVGTAQPEAVVVAITPLDPDSNAAPSPEIHAIAVAAAQTATQPEEVRQPIESAPTPAPSAAPVVESEKADKDAQAPSDDKPALAGARLLLKPQKTGTHALELCALAAELGKSPEALLAILLECGLVAPEKPREKPVFVERSGEIFWLNRNAKGELWLNAKESKYQDADEKPRKPRRPKKSK